jgi:hypothetical protein
MQCWPLCLGTYVVPCNRAAGYHQPAEPERAIFRGGTLHTALPTSKTQERLHTMRYTAGTPGLGQSCSSNASSEGNLTLWLESKDTKSPKLPYQATLLQSSMQSLLLR